MHFCLKMISIVFHFLYLLSLPFFFASSFRDFLFPYKALTQHVLPLQMMGFFFLSFK